MPLSAPGSTCCSAAELNSTMASRVSSHPDCPGLPQSPPGCGTAGLTHQVDADYVHMFMAYKYREDFYSIKSKFIHLMSKLNGWDKFGILTNCNKTSAPPHRSTNQHQPSLTSNNLPFLSLPVSANQMLRFCHASSDFLNETSLVNVTVQYNYRAVLLNILRVSFSTNVIVSSHKAMRVMLNYKPKQVGKKS